jgi:uncharacterized membrane protein
MNMTKKYFITGLVILLPLALTVGIVVFVFNLLTTPFLGAVKAIFDRYNLFETGFIFFDADQLQNLIAQSLILFSLIIFTIGLGVIARWFFFRTLLRIADFVVRHIPLVSSIYKTCQDVIKTIFNSKANSFQQVVIVRFPNPETCSIGLVTREQIPSLKDTSYENVIAVFVPTTPNPTSGFLIMCKPEDLIYLDMKVEDAFKYIISCGVILPSFNAIQKETKVLTPEELSLS